MYKIWMNTANTNTEIKSNEAIYTFKEIKDSAFQQSVVPISGCNYFAKSCLKNMKKPKTEQLKNFQME